ncbi:MAG: ABC transporter substrate-binding protein, partial [Coriobacteriales bacterium]
MKKKLPILALVICLVASACAVCGCSGSNSSASGDTKTVTDAYGRSVTVPKSVDRVATVGSGARFVVYAGAQDKLVAVTEMETSPAMNRPYTIVYKDLFSQLPATSNGNHLLETNVNTEELLKANPQVIVSSRSADECESLQNSTGIPVIGITYQNQLFTDNVYNSITCVGEACGTSDHANEVVSKLKDWDNDLKTRTKDISDDQKPSVYVGAVNYKGAKSFGGTYAHYAPLDELSAKNVADETGQNGALDADLEQIANWNPDYMFLNAGNMDLMRADYESNEAFFNSLTAFREGHLYTQPFFNFNGTNVDTGICDTYFIGATIYPEAVSD